MAHTQLILALLTRAPQATTLTESRGDELRLKTMVAWCSGLRRLDTDFRDGWRDLGWRSRQCS
jgi:hypothetical protein